MAKIKAGILSKVSGKVAGVVGGTWKGTNYLRELVKPANPNTPLQQAQRGKMSFVVKAARQLVGDVLNPYLNKFCKTMSGYNWFCKENIAKASGTPLKFTSAPALSFGTLASGSMESDLVACDYGFNLKSKPTVAAGHTLRAVWVLIDENGAVLNIQTQDDPSLEQNYFDNPDLPTVTARTVVYGLLFFADIDANGVLQAISANITSTGALVP